MVKINLYTIRGNKGKDIEFPGKLVGEKNIKLLSQAIRIYEDRKHPGTSKVKSRGEVSLSTRKIYRQKGTGHARHGAKSAPIFVGGGIAHGPKGIKRTLKLSKKIKNAALKAALAVKLEKKVVVAVDKLNDLKKTKDAYGLISNIISKLDISKKPKVMIVINSEAKNIIKAVKNIQDVGYTLVNNLNAYSVYYSDILVFDKNVLTSKVQESKKSTASKKPETKKIEKVQKNMKKKTEKQATRKDRKDTKKTK